MSRKEILYKAELAKETGRYGEMVGIMKCVVKECVDVSKELTDEESDLLFYAYENLIVTKTRNLELFRSSPIIEQKEESLGNEDHVLKRRNLELFRSSPIIEQKEEESLGNEDHVSKRKDNEGKIEGELTEICNEILDLLEENLIPLASSTESKVFYMRKKAEFYDSLVQFKTGAEKDDAYESMMSTYRAAEDIEQTHLATGPLPDIISMPGQVTFSELMEMFRLNEIEKKQALKEGRPHEDALGEIYHKMLILRQ